VVEAERRSGWDIYIFIHSPRLWSVEQLDGGELYELESVWKKAIVTQFMIGLQPENSPRGNGENHEPR